MKRKIKIEPSEFVPRSQVVQHGIRLVHAASGTDQQRPSFFDCRIDASGYWIRGLSEEAGEISESPDAHHMSSDAS